MSESVERLKKAVHFTPMQITWVPQESFHITLYFLGELSQSVADRLGGFLTEAPVPVAPFLIDMRHLGTFPNDGKAPPRVLWAGMHQPPEALQQVRLHAGSLIARAGLPLPAQDFTPHVTLARFKSTKGLFVFKKLLETYRFAKFGKCEVGRLVLMESLTGGGPARYVPFQTAPLQRPSN